MIVRDGDCLRVSGAMVMANAKTLLAAASGLFDQPQVTVDLAAVGAADSSALAVMLAWLRQAQAENRQLHFANLPDSIRALADLYGVDALLPQV